MFDDGRNFVAMNDAYCELTGYTRDEVLTLQAGESLAGDEHARRAFEEIVADRAKSAAGRDRLRRKDGTVLDVFWLTISAHIAGMPYFIAMIWPADAAPFSVPA